MNLHNIREGFATTALYNWGFVAVGRVLAATGSVLWRKGRGSVGRPLRSLAGAVSQEDLQELRERMDRTRSLVPTHPHPGAPTSPGAKAAASPPVALIDQIRDAIRNAGD